MDYQEKRKYLALSNDSRTSSSDESKADSQHRLLQGDEDECIHNIKPTPSHFRTLMIANCVLFVISIAALATAIVLVERTGWQGREMNHALKQTSAYSPVLDLLEIPMNTVQFNGTLFATDPNPIYRQPPSPEVDAAWKEISELGFIGISKEDVERLGKDPSISVTAPDSWGLGKRNHLAFIDVFHQIHCLDMLRQAAHYDYYYSARFGPEGPTNVYWSHIEHCSYMLLQTLKCHADVDVFTYTWVEGQMHPYPDFGANHQCRNFDAIWDWTRVHQLDGEKLENYLKPEGTVSQPEPGTFPGQSHWAFQRAHGEFSENYQAPT